MDKLSKGVLKHDYSRHQHTDELSMVCYFVNKNMEKQVVSLLKNLCLHNNKEIQNFMRMQTTNTKSYNIIEIVTNYCGKFLNHLQYPVAYDTFLRILECLLEFNYGPNIINQDIVIQKGFIQIANEILKMDYKDDQEVKEEGGRNLNKKTQSGGKTEHFNSKHFLANPSPLSSAKNFSRKDKNEINWDEVTQPKTNFMISMLKYKTLLILSQLLVGRNRSSSVYYSLRKILDPDVFRRNFAYQKYFISKFHSNQYSLKMFFRYNLDVNDEKNSPLIMEVGFQLYFMIMKMSSNLAVDMDEKYYNRLIKLLSIKEANLSTNSKGLIFNIYSFTLHMKNAIFSCYKKNK